jgi:hypothetical protein
MRTSRFSEFKKTIRALMLRGAATPNRALTRSNETGSMVDFSYYNTITHTYERCIFAFEHITSECTSLLSFEFAVSLFPNPLIPAGPYGWYGDLEEIFEQFPNIHFKPWGDRALDISAIEEASFRGLTETITSHALSILETEASRLKKKGEIINFIKYYETANGLAFDAQTASPEGLKRVTDCVGDYWKWVMAGFGLKGS